MPALEGLHHVTAITEGMPYSIAWHVAAAALHFWSDRLSGEGVEVSSGEGGALRFCDPEGLEHVLVVEDVPDRPLVARADGIPADRRRMAARARRPRRLPVFITHGAGDPIIGVEFARDAIARLEPAGLDVQYHEHGGGHTIDPSTVPALQAWMRQRVAAFAPEAA